MPRGYLLISDQQSAHKTAQTSLSNFLPYILPFSQNTMGPVRAETDQDVVVGVRAAQPGVKGRYTNGGTVDFPFMTQGMWWPWEDILFNSWATVAPVAEEVRAAASYTSGVAMTISAPTTTRAFKIIVDIDNGAGTSDAGTYTITGTRGGYPRTETGSFGAKGSGVHLALITSSKFFDTVTGVTLTHTDVADTATINANDLIYANTLSCGTTVPVGRTFARVVQDVDNNLNENVDVGCMLQEMTLAFNADAAGQLSTTWINHRTYPETNLANLTAPFDPTPTSLSGETQEDNIPELRYVESATVVARFDDTDYNTGSGISVSINNNWTQLNDTLNGTYFMEKPVQGLPIVTLSIPVQNRRSNDPTVYNFYGKEFQCDVFDFKVFAQWDCGNEQGDFLINFPRARLTAPPTYTQTTGGNYLMGLSLSVENSVGSQTPDWCNLTVNSLDDATA